MILLPPAKAHMKSGCRVWRFVRFCCCPRWRVRGSRSHCSVFSRKFQGPAAIIKRRLPSLRHRSYPEHLFRHRKPPYDPSVAKKMEKRVLAMKNSRRKKKVARLRTQSLDRPFLFPRWQVTIGLQVALTRTSGKTTS